LLLLEFGIGFGTSIGSWSKVRGPARASALDQEPTRISAL